MTSDDGPLARAMRETLDAVVTPAVREALIHDALILAGLGALPQRGEAMRAFAGEHLRAVVARALGAEMAASITEEILLTIGPSAPPPSGGRGQTQRVSRAPSYRRVHTPPPPTRRTPVIVSRPDSKRPVAFPRSPTPAGLDSRHRGSPVASAWPASTGARPPRDARSDGLARALRDTDPAGDPNAPRSSAPVSGTTPLVLVATQDPSLVAALAAACDGGARVSAVKSPADLIKRLEARAGARSVVLLDGGNPSVRPAALAVLLEDSPEVEVVFFRADPAAEAFALSVSASVRRWAVHHDAPLDQLAAECVRRASP